MILDLRLSYTVWLTPHLPLKTANLKGFIKLVNCMHANQFCFLNLQNLSARLFCVRSTVISSLIYHQRYKYIMLISALIKQEILSFCLVLHLRVYLL